jgi:hypothetical protein
VGVDGWPPPGGGDIVIRMGENWFDQTAMAERWQKRQDSLWRAFRYSFVEAWSGHCGPPWDDGPSQALIREAPFHYLYWLHAGGRIGSGFDFVADIDMGLYIEPGARRRAPALTNPDAPLETLPAGRVEALELHIETRTGTCVEALVTIASRSVLIVAGDIVDGVATWSDEELLLFDEPSDADRVQWASEREFRVVTID